MIVQEETPSPPATDVATGSLEFAKATFAHVQELVKVADAKATSLIALQAIIFAIFGTGLADDLVKVIRGGTTTALVLAGLAVLTALATVASVGSGILVLVPRSPQHTDVKPPTGATGLLWIDTLKKFKQDPDAYLLELKRVDANATLAEFGFENLKVTWILERKFYWLKWAQRLLAPAFVLWLALIFVVVAFPPLTSPTA